MDGATRNGTLAEQDQLLILIEAVTDYAICMLDPRGIVTTWNSGAHRLQGYSTDEIVKHHFSRLYTEDDQTAGLLAHALEFAVAYGKFENEGWQVRKGGSRFWANVVINAIRDTSGRIVGFAHITSDLRRPPFGSLNCVLKEKASRISSSFC